MKPLAFFITFRSYATHLPGDARGFVTRAKNVYGTPPRPANARLYELALASLTQAPQELGPEARAVVARAIHAHALREGWTLHALNVRTNHVHLVVTGDTTPERIMTALKACATLRLRKEGPVGGDVRPWARHGSTRWLWTTEALRAACVYVMEGQGAPLDSAEAGETPA